MWPSTTQGDRHAHRVCLRLPLPLCPFSEAVIPTFPRTGEKNGCPDKGDDTEDFDATEEEELIKSCSPGPCDVPSENVRACDLTKSKEDGQMSSKGNDGAGEAGRPAQGPTDVPPKVKGDEAAGEEPVDQAACGEQHHRLSRLVSENAAQEKSSRGILPLGSSLPATSFRFDACLPLSSTSSFAALPPILCVPTALQTSSAPPPAPAGAGRSSAVTVECCCVLFRALNGCCHHVLAFLLLLAREFLKGRSPKCAFQLETRNNHEAASSNLVEEDKAPSSACHSRGCGPQRNGGDKRCPSSLHVEDCKGLRTATSSKRRNSGRQPPDEQLGGDSGLHALRWERAGAPSSLRAPSAPSCRTDAPLNGRDNELERGSAGGLACSVPSKTHRESTDLVEGEDSTGLPVASVSSSVADCLAAVSTGGSMEAEGEEGGGSLSGFTFSSDPTCPTPVRAPVSSPQRPHPCCLSACSSSPSLLASSSSSSVRSQQNTSSFSPIAPPTQASSQATVSCTRGLRNCGGAPEGSCSSFSGEEEVGLSSPATLCSVITRSRHNISKKKPVDSQRGGKEDCPVQPVGAESPLSGAPSVGAMKGSFFGGDSTLMKGHREDGNERGGAPRRSGDNQKQPNAQVFRWSLPPCPCSGGDAVTLGTWNANPSCGAQERVVEFEASDERGTSCRTLREPEAGRGGKVASSQCGSSLCETASNCAKGPDRGEACQGTLSETKRRGGSPVLGNTASVKALPENRPTGGIRKEALQTSGIPGLPVPGWETEDEEGFVTPVSDTTCATITRGRGRSRARETNADSSAFCPRPADKEAGCSLHSAGCGCRSNALVAEEKGGRRKEDGVFKSPSPQVRASSELCSPRQTVCIGGFSFDGGEKRKKEQEEEDRRGARKRQVRSRHSERLNGALQAWSPVSVVTRGSASRCADEMRKPLQMARAGEEDAIFEDSENEVTQDIHGQDGREGALTGERIVSSGRRRRTDREGDARDKEETAVDILRSCSGSVRSPPSAFLGLGKVRACGALRRFTPPASPPTGTAAGGSRLHARSSDSLIHSSFFSPASFLSTSPSTPRLRRASVESRVRRNSHCTVATSSSPSFWSPLSAASPPIPSTTSFRFSSSASSSCSPTPRLDVASRPRISSCVSPGNAPDVLQVRGSSPSPRSPSPRVHSSVERGGEQTDALERVREEGCLRSEEPEENEIDCTTAEDKQPLSELRDKAAVAKVRWLPQGQGDGRAATAGRRANAGAGRTDETRLTPDMKKELWRKVAARFSTQPVS